MRLRARVAADAISPRRKAMRHVSTIRFVALAVGLACTWAPAWAVDGVVLIDQNRALAGNATPGDTPGFPVTITQPGSYRLAGNLLLPDGNSTAIEIKASHVTIDLNGFAILGPVDCSAGFPCANAGTFQSHAIVAGSDVPARAFNDITIRNGTIAGAGADAVHILGDTVVIEDLRLRDLGLSGVVVRTTTFSTKSVIVRGNTIERVGSYGVKVDAGLVTDNSVALCGNSGIKVESSAGLVTRNVVNGCVEFGLVLNPQVAYSGNTLVGSNGGGAQVASGINTGQNVCGGTVCAGALY